jgi:hypothetical protein
MLALYTLSSSWSIGLNRMAEASTSGKTKAVTLCAQVYYALRCLSLMVSPTTRMPEPLYGSGGLIFRRVDAICVT